MPGPLLALLPMLAQAGMQLYQDSKGQAPPSAGMGVPGGRNPIQTPETSGGAALSQYAGSTPAASAGVAGAQGGQGPVAPAASPLTPGANYGNVIQDPTRVVGDGMAQGMQPGIQTEAPGGGGASTGLGYAQAAMGAGQTLHDLFAKDGKPPAGAGYGARGGFSPGPSMRLGDLYGQARRRYY